VVHAYNMSTQRLRKEYLELEAILSYKARL
jgi:hypothetical protein